MTQKTIELASIDQAQELVIDERTIATYDAARGPLTVAPGMWVPRILQSAQATPRHGEDAASAERLTRLEFSALGQFGYTTQTTLAGGCALRAAM